MLMHSADEHLYTSDGELLVSEVIAGLGAERGTVFAQLCTDRVGRLNGHPAFADSLEAVMSSMRFAGWFDQPTPPGMVEAETLTRMAGQIVLSANPPGTLLYPDSPLRLDADAALAAERDWVWAALARFYGEDDADGAVLRSLAATWPSDFESLLEAAEAAAG